MYKSSLPLPFTQYDALYARQSVEKKDSISVESQLEYCRYETHGNPYTEYMDKGFSGKNTRRPGFEKMIQDIAYGKIKRVIVYKLDRISRSIVDFANMMELFQKYNVEFVSSTEKFDTSTPIGRAMLNICIVFAQLERETIQKRVTDAYYARCKRGFYMGGRIPYGYRLKKTVIDNIPTSMYEEVPEESLQLKLIYSMYADTSNSLGDIVRYLKEHRIKHLRGSDWSTARISELLRNPIYVRADIHVYRFFQKQGADIYNPAHDFTGSNACYLYKGNGSGSSARSALTDRELILAPHQGFISSETWLACRARCLNSRQSAKTCKPKNSWLSGKVKCKNCGYALTIRKSQTKWSRYFVCSHSGSNGTCKGTGCTVYADVLEEYVQNAIGETLAALPNLCPETERSCLLEAAEQNLRLAQIEEEIKALVSTAAGANNILMHYLNERISELDRTKQALENQLLSGLRANPDVLPESPAYSADLWKALSFEDKQTVTDLFIKVIRIANNTIELVWEI